MKNTGFTLAETLITLGILGIVSAITLPSVINKFRALVLEKLFMKTYSELNQISRRFYYDYGISIPEYTQRTANENLPPNWHKLVDNIFPSYLKSMNKLSSPSADTSIHKIHAMSGADTLNICDNSGFMFDNTGKIYAFNDAPYPNENGPVICVDINGKKAPNKYGYDFFLFIFTLDGYVIPMGQSHINNTQTSGGGYNFFNASCNPNNDNAFLSQTGCAYYALKNKHPYKENKTYWKDFVYSK